MQHGIEAWPAVAGESHAIRGFRLVELPLGFKAEGQVIVSLRIRRMEREHFPEPLGGLRMLLATVVEHAEMEVRLGLVGTELDSPQEPFLRFARHALSREELRLHGHYGRALRMARGQAGQSVDGGLDPALREGSLHLGQSLFRADATGARRGGGQQPDRHDEQVAATSMNQRQVPPCWPQSIAGPGPGLPCMVRGPLSG